MESQRHRNICHCHRSAISLSSTLLFLSWILPTSSFAQLTPSIPSTSSNIPTTLLRSTIPSSSSPSSSTSSSNPPSTQTQIPPPAAATTTDSSTLNTVGDHAFNYYFLIVAAFAILFCVCIIWFGRRKKRKAAIMRSQSQRALARDVEGWRTRFRAGRGNGIGREEEREEGLDERGEAPPPYALGSKPPSIRSERSSINGPSGTSGEEVELRRLDTVNNPPGYHEAARGGMEEDGDITRPRTAVMASERFASMRRLLSTTGSSSQA